MSKKKCDMICDLLPLYAENICSDMSRNIVVEHISECKECREMLDKMNTPLEISVDSDIESMKKLKKKIGIKKIIVGFIAAIAASALCFGLFMYEMMPVNLNYVDCDIEHNVEIQVDDEGVVWLGRHSEAGAPAYIVEVRKSKSGEMYPYNMEYDGEDPVAYGFSLYEERYNLSFGVLSGRMEYSRLFSTKTCPNVDYIFYYDEKTGEEHIIWEKNK